jgi:hypothetical protein
LRSDVGRRGGVLLAARREARWATRASSWVRTVEKGRSDASGAGEQGLCGWCSVRWRPELFWCGKSAKEYVSPGLLGELLVHFYQRFGISI